MPPIEFFKDGGQITHHHSDAMVALAEKWLQEYFAAFGSKRPGDLEDDLVGSLDILHPQGPWRRSPFYPALGRLVDKGIVHYWVDGEGDYWYNLKGAEPS